MSCSASQRDSPSTKMLSVVTATNSYRKDSPPVVRVVRPAEEHRGDKSSRHHRDVDDVDTRTHDARAVEGPLPPAAKEQHGRRTPDAESPPRLPPRSVVVVKAARKDTEWEDERRGGDRAVRTDESQSSARNYRTERHKPDSDRSTERSASPQPPVAPQRRNVDSIKPRNRSPSPSRSAEVYTAVAVGRWGSPNPGDDLREFWARGSVSPVRRSDAPQRRSQSPRQRRSRSPQQRRLRSTQQRRSRSPQQRRSRSPQHHSRSPQRRLRSPQRRSRSPQRPQRSPQRRSRSLPRRSRSPLQHRPRSPRRHSRSPQRRPPSPHRRSRSPQRRSRSPQRHSRSPQRQPRSPRRTRESPPRHRRPSPRREPNETLPSIGSSRLPNDDGDSHRSARRRSRSPSEEGEWRRPGPSRSHWGNHDERGERASTYRRSDAAQADAKIGGGNSAGMTDVRGSNAAAATGETLKPTASAYIPRFRLMAMQAEAKDRSGPQFQRLAWEALKNSINRAMNQLNVGNLKLMVRQLLALNLVRGRGLFCRAVLRAQSASPSYTNVYAALIAVVNTRFPQNGELLLSRLIGDFKKSFRRNDKKRCLSTTQMIAHLVNQHVCHEILALEILSLLLGQPTNDSVEVAVGFMKEVGAGLTDVSPRGVHGVFERFRSILNDAVIEIRVQYMIEVLFQIRRDGFKEYPAIKEKDLEVDEEEQVTHMMTLEEEYDVEDKLNVFQFDDDYEVNEAKYGEIRAALLPDESADEESGSGSDDDDDDGDSSGEDEDKSEAATTQTADIVDNTETNLVVFRRTVYLTIQSSLDFEEAAHKLMKMQIKPGQEYELCNMIMDCCAQLRTYEKYFGLMAQRFCQIAKVYVEEYEKIFVEQYNTIHRLETVKLRNVAKFFAHLLHSDAISWGVLQVIKLTEESTTSSGRIFIKILFQELSEFMGLGKLAERLKDQTLSVFFDGVFPRDNPKDTRFAINFFTAIDLGVLTIELREHLKGVIAKKKAKREAQANLAVAHSSSDNSGDSLSDESGTDSSSS